MVDKKDFVNEYINSLFIYGTGITGRALYETLKKDNIIAKGFIVSDEKHKDSIQYPVYTLHTWKSLFYKSNYLIIVAVSLPYQKDIFQLLKENNITNWIVVHEEDIIPKPVTVLDTTLCDDNLGNQIIMESIYEVLKDIYKKEFLYRIQYRDTLGKHALNCAKESKYVFMGGTNILRNDMENEVTWGINEENSKILKNKLILMGVGWWQYQISRINNYTYNLLHYVLNNQMIHSVRDGYTLNQLKKIGIENVLNTGCPSIWKLDENFCKKIPQNKADEVLLMLTPNNRKRDEYILDILKQNYRKIYCWIQSAYDYKYAISLGITKNIIPPRLEALESFLQKNMNVEYVGTRLHGGIKCLQHKKRAIIIGIDNRAKEMGKDFLLPVLDEQDLTLLENKINQPLPIMLKLPRDKIKMWVQQFE